MGHRLGLVGDELDFGIARQIGDAQTLSEPQRSNVQLNGVGNIRRQALNRNLAQHLFEDAALGLDAFRNTRQLHRHFDAQRLIHRNAFEVDVHHRALYGLVLPIDDHRLGMFRAQL